LGKKIGQTLIVVFV